MRTPRIYGLSAPMSPSYYTAPRTVAPSFSTSYNPRRNGVYLGASWYASLSSGYPTDVPPQPNLEALVLGTYSLSPFLYGDPTSSLGYEYAIFRQAFYEGAATMMRSRTGSSQLLGTTAFAEAARQWTAAVNNKASALPRGY